MISRRTLLLAVFQIHARPCTSDPVVEIDSAKAVHVTVPNVAKADIAHAIADGFVQPVQAARLAALLTSATELAFTLTTRKCV